MTVPLAAACIAVPAEVARSTASQPWSPCDTIAPVGRGFVKKPLSATPLIPWHGLPLVLSHSTEEFSPDVLPPVKAWLDDFVDVDFFEVLEEVLVVDELLFEPDDVSSPPGMMIVEPA
jgi:hypothetical protein